MFQALAIGQSKIIVSLTLHDDQLTLSANFIKTKLSKKKESTLKSMLSCISFKTQLKTSPARDFNPEPPRVICI